VVHQDRLLDVLVVLQDALDLVVGAQAVAGIVTSSLALIGYVPLASLRFAVEGRR